MSVQTMTLVEPLKTGAFSTAAESTAMSSSQPSGPQADFDGDVKVSQKLPSEKELKGVAELPVLDAQNRSRPFKSLFAADQGGRRVLILFIRHFFCGVSGPVFFHIATSLT